MFDRIFRARFSMVFNKFVCVVGERLFGAQFSHISLLSIYSSIERREIEYCILRSENSFNFASEIAKSLHAKSVPKVSILILTPRQRTCAINASLEDGDRKLNCRFHVCNNASCMSSRNLRKFENGPKN